MCRLVQDSSPTMLRVWMRLVCSENIMGYTIEQEQRRDALLDGISQNLSFKELAARLGIRRGTLIRDIRAMRWSNDSGLLEAQRLAQDRVEEERQLVSAGHEARFLQMTGMSISEKTFQNMVFFYRAEILSILNSGDSVAVIRGLPSGVRKTLLHNKILVNRVRPEISKRARDALL